MPACGRGRVQSTRDPATWIDLRRPTWDEDTHDGTARRQFGELRQGQPGEAVAVDGRREGDLGMGPSATLTHIDQRITGRAYLFAMLRDPRIASLS
jgi:hypothetical protein